MNTGFKKALISATISAAGALLVNVGTWLGSGHVDAKVLVVSLTTAFSSWLIAVGRILAQTEANVPPPQAN